MSRLTEDAMCELFADQMATSRPFTEWVLESTRFAPDAKHVRLLDEEQRPGRMRWWRHWWVPIAGLRDSETDIFATFERPDEGRFALHIEMKLAHSKWTHPDQAKTYAVRAQYMSKRPDKMNYEEWATVLLAPRSFIAKWPTETLEFDHVISFEDVSVFIPEFGQNGALGGTR